MLVAQSRNHKLTLVSADAALRGRTEIAQIWAR
jgi:PIN domain nuclease of toxin-antitoxin system